MLCSGGSDGPVEAGIAASVVQGEVALCMVLVIRWNAFMVNIALLLEHLLVNRVLSRAKRYLNSLLLCT